MATSVGKTGHVAIIALEDSRTVNAEWYTTVCLPQVNAELRKSNSKRRIILHNDNARQTIEYLKQEKVEILDHPPYTIINLHTISKLCIIAKVFEKIIYNQLFPSLRKTFSPFQHGFLKGRSTATNLTLFNDFITNAMDDGKQVRFKELYSHYDNRHLHENSINND